MNVATVFIKVKQRLNKLSSNDYDNLECWHVVEAFNKAQSQWCRRQLHGFNQFKEGDEQSNRRIDDLQILLTTATLNTVDREGYQESLNWPSDYMQYKNIELFATKDCCTDARRMVVYLVEEGNVPLYLKDEMRNPNFEWGETFATLVGNRVRIYTNDEFAINSAAIMYYRQPRPIQIANCIDPYTGVLSTANVDPEFKDDIVEVLIDETAGVIAGDIESLIQYQRAETNIEKNN